MVDLAKIAKAKIELEELYSGIPDESVNLTFQDFAEVRQQNPQFSTIEKKSSLPLDPIIEASPRREEESPLTKLPSLDFSRALEASARSEHQIHYQSHHLPHLRHLSPMNHMHHGLDGHAGAAGMHGHRGHHYGHQEATQHAANGHHHAISSPYSHHGKQNNSMVYDDTSNMSGITMASLNGFPEKKGRRRPGIPHSNICTICTTYIYIFRHRCLVCGRAYCRKCSSIGMGEMTEGRKCIECLGRRFSQRYIQRAGQVGCCMGYPSMVKQEELKWAEKGARGNGENRHGRSGMVSRSRSPAPRTPTRGHNPSNNQPSFVSNGQSSFVMGSPYSPYYSPTNHPLPF